MLPSLPLHVTTSARSAASSPSPHGDWCELTIKHYKICLSVRLFFFGRVHSIPAQTGIDNTPDPGHPEPVRHVRQSAGPAARGMGTTSHRHIRLSRLQTQRRREGQQDLGALLWAWQRTSCLPTQTRWTSSRSLHPSSSSSPACPYDQYIDETNLKGNEWCHFGYRPQRPPTPPEPHHHRRPRPTLRCNNPDAEPAK